MISYVNTKMILAKPFKSQELQKNHKYVFFLDGTKVSKEDADVFRAELKELSIRGVVLVVDEDVNNAIKVVTRKD